MPIWLINTAKLRIFYKLLTYGLIIYRFLKNSLLSLQTLLRLLARLCVTKRQRLFAQIGQKVAPDVSRFSQTIIDGKFLVALHGGCVELRLRLAAQLLNTRALRLVR